MSGAVDNSAPLVRLMALTGTALPLQDHNAEDVFSETTKLPAVIRS
jgi:hypothetical protein